MVVKSVLAAAAAFFLMSSSGAGAATYSAFLDEDVGTLSGPGPYQFTKTDMTALLQGGATNTLSTLFENSAVGDFTPTTIAGFGAPIGSSGNFLYAETFTLGVPAQILAYPNPLEHSFSFEFVQGTPTVNGNDITLGTAIDLNTAATTFLAAGVYSFIATGSLNFDVTAAQRPQALFTAEVDPVPLPGAAGMFGAALLGMIALGGSRRRTV